VASQKSVSASGSARSTTCGWHPNVVATVYENIHNARGGNDSVQGLAEMADLASTSILCEHFYGFEPFRYAAVLSLSMHHSDGHYSDSIEGHCIFDFVMQEVSLVQPCMATLVYALALFHHLWENGQRMQVVLVQDSQQYAAITGHPELLIRIADMLHWCLWAATVAYWDSACRFKWYIFVVCERHCY
jgi:hypothetical protein